MWGSRPSPRIRGLDDKGRELARRAFTFWAADPKPTTISRILVECGRDSLHFRDQGRGRLSPFPGDRGHCFGNGCENRPAAVLVVAESLARHNPAEEHS